MSLKEIEKLKERVDKDPNSKLFVPLAEEYRKEGMLDEAISALMSGLERQPGYMSARVSLGKIFLEKGMADEARGEFENVIKSIPDNLYAHKKLAEIYRDMGKREMSLRSYRTVIKLNPLDEDAISSLRELEEEELRGTEETPPAAPEALVGAEPLSGQDAAEGAAEEAIAEEEMPAAAPEETAEIDADDLNAFKDSLFGDKAVAEDVDVAASEDIDVLEEAYEISDSTEEEPAEAVEELPAEEEEMSFADVGAAIEETPPPGMAYAEEETGVGDGEAALPAEEAAWGPIAVEKAEIEDADRFIAGGDYLRAIQVYRDILTADPDNRVVLQRAEELRALLKLLGKDKDALIARLNAFLEGITNRRNEFYGRS
jgi:tetratricopeptide (TPR) repeat protein